MTEAEKEQHLFPKLGGEGQAPRGCVKSPWSCDRSGNWPQDRKEPGSSTDLFRGQSAHSGSTYEPPGVGQSSQPQGLPLSLFPSWTDLLHLPPRSEQEQGEAVHPGGLPGVVEAIVTEVWCWSLGNPDPVVLLCLPS